jgi:segregation and condensation protein B
LAGGWQLLTIQQFAPLLARLHTDRQQTRLSQAALETLSIVAYRQPIMRAEIEAIRGVACGEVLRSLMERRLIKITGRAEELGRPMLYGTTNEFLKVFGLSSVDDLPDVQGLKEDRSKKKSEKEAKSQAGEAEQSADEKSGEADSSEPASEDASSREENADAVSR